MTASARIGAGPLDLTSPNGPVHAFEAARPQVADWLRENAAALFNPVVVHVVSAEDGPIPDLEARAQELKANGTLLFHCCFYERFPDNIVVPCREEVPPGLASQLFDVSSEMPALVQDVDELLRGRVSPRLQHVGESVLESHGVPPVLASLGADLLGGALRGGLRLPTARPGWTVGVGARVEGLRINSHTGFALVKGMIGFKIFTKLFN